MSEALPGNPTGRKPTFDDHPRFLGLIFLALGLICGAVACYFPIHDALAGAAQVTISRKALAGFVIFTILGLTLIILGPVAVRLAYKSVALSRWKRWLIVGLILVFFLICTELVQQAFEEYLRTLGRKF